MNFCTSPGDLFKTAIIPISFPNKIVGNYRWLFNSVPLYFLYIQLGDILYMQLESCRNNRSGGIPINFKV